eukprot:gene35409-biopygen23147
MLMSISVHTNQSALVALQNLNKTNDQLASAQNRISTGLKVQGPKDNASVWGIAQSQRADIGALGLGDTPDRGVVFRPLDLEARADPVLGAGELVVGLVQVLKRDKRGLIGVDADRHEHFPRTALLDVTRLTGPPRPKLGGRTFAYG